MIAVATPMEAPGRVGDEATVPHGYQMTVFGVVPNDWEIVKFADLFDFKNGVNADKSAYGQGVPFANVLEVITNTHLRRADIPGLVSLTRPVIDSYALRRGDLLFNRTSETQEEVGLSSVYLDDALAVFGGFVIRGRPARNSLDPVYSGYAFRAPVVRSQIIAKGQGAIRANIGQADLRRVCALMPAPPEQRAIAAALWDVDELIGALDKLISKKRAIRLGVMQELLTGNTRLPGFTKSPARKQTEVGVIPADWDAVPLDEVFTFKNGLNKAKQYFGSGTPIVNYMDVFGRPWLQAGDLMGRVSLSPQEIKNFGVQRGDVFFTRTSETVDEIGMTSVMLDDVCDTVFSGFVLRARPKDDRLDDQYKKYCFSTLSVRKQIVSKATYTTRALTNGRLLSAVSIARPPLEEQRAIGAHLSDMDAEITALERQRQKIKAIKLGMMQSLLTGRVRLVKPGSKA